MEQHHGSHSTATAHQRNELRRLLLENVTAHVRETHQIPTGTCWADRLGLIAWLMHALGLTAEDCERLQDFVAAYEIGCPCLPLELFSAEVVAQKDAAASIGAEWLAEAQAKQFPDEIAA